MFGEILGSNAWLVNEREKIPYQERIIRYRYHRLRHVRRPNFLAGCMSHAPHTPSSAKHLDFSWGPLTSVVSSLGYVAPDAPNQKEYDMVVDL